MAFVVISFMTSVGVRLLPPERVSVGLSPRALSAAPGLSWVCLRLRLCFGRGPAVDFPAPVLRMGREMP